MRNIWFFLTFGMIGAAILIGLGVWQMQRLSWKQEILAEIEMMVAAPPMPLATAANPHLTKRYSPVQVTGRFGQEHLRVLASRKTIGAVYRVIRPFDAEGVGRILVDTGWIRSGNPIPDVPTEIMRLIGNIDVPNEIDGFTPEPDLEGNTWFARDVPAMAQALAAKEVFVVLRDAPTGDIGTAPWPVDTGNIPNNHLQYAITWFSLALIWLAMTTYFLMRGRRANTDTAS